jgi:hypothetical protein
MAGRFILQIWLADFEQEHIAGGVVWQIWHGVDQEHIAGGLILQI